MVFEIRVSGNYKLLIINFNYMDKDQKISVKNQTLVYLNKQEHKGLTLETIFKDLNIRPFPIPLLGSYLDEMSREGYVSRANISGSRTVYRITTAGKNFVTEGGYRGQLLNKQSFENTGPGEKDGESNVEKKKLFISYANANLNKVTLIKKKLANHPLFEPYVVADKRKANNALVKLVREGIEASYCIIPILSPQSYKEQWINQEIGYAEGAGRQIIPIVGDSTLDKLKGFVHKQNQCPYTYKSTRGLAIRDENKGFMQCFRLLIDDLEKEVTTQKKDTEEETKKANQSFNDRPNTKIIGIV
jgi:hypothetical protein